MNKRGWQKRQLHQNTVADAMTWFNDCLQMRLGLLRRQRTLVVKAKAKAPVAVERGPLSAATAGVNKTRSKRLTLKSRKNCGRRAPLCIQGKQAPCGKLRKRLPLVSPGTCSAAPLYMPMPTRPGVFARQLFGSRMQRLHDPALRPGAVAALTQADQVVLQGL